MGHWSTHVSRQVSATVDISYRALACGPAHLHHRDVRRYRTNRETRGSAAVAYSLPSLSIQFGRYMRLCPREGLRVKFYCPEACRCNEVDSLFDGTVVQSDAVEAHDH